MKTAEPKSAPSQQHKTANNSFFDRGQESAFFTDRSVDRTSFFPATDPKSIQAKSLPGHKPFFSHTPAAIQAKCATCATQEQAESEPVQAESPQIQMMPAFESAADGDDAGSEQPFVQFSLKVGQPGDAHEREADRVAAQVMNMPAPSSQPAVQRQTAGEDNEIQPKSLAKDITPLVQRKEHSGSSNASPNLESRLNSSKGGGNPLPDGVKSFMEPRFGTDFSQVRVHTDSAAVQMNQDLQAQAFTHGSDVYFGAGQSPGKNDLTAHELTHTVQQGSSGINKKLIIQKVEGDKKTKKPIKEATQKDFDDIGKVPRIGQILINDDDKKLKFEIANFVAKSYVERSDTRWLKRPIKIPKSAKSARSDEHRKNWKDAVRAGVTDKVDKNLKVGKIKSNDNLMLRLHKNDNTGIIGSKDQIIDKISVPCWDYSGEPIPYDIEHVIDIQIGGENDGVNDMKNLFLLDSRKNREYGRIVNNEIKSNLEEIANFYREHFTGLPKKGSDIKAKYDVTINRFEYQRENIGNYKLFYSKEDIMSQGRYNPYKLTNVSIQEVKIPKNHFLLKTSEQGLGYILPYNAKNKKIGAWSISVVQEGNEKIKSLQFALAEDNPKKKQPYKIPGGKLEDITPDETAPQTYVLKDYASKKLQGQLNYVMKGLTVNHLSPVQITESSIEGFGVLVKGKIVSDLSILKDVDINFIFEDGDFTMVAEIPLNQIAKNVPKPFNVDTCSLIISASTAEGFTIAGQVGFSVGKLGEGEISVGFNTASGIFFDGAFNFNNKYFNPAQISIEYKKGEWSIGGKIGIQQGLIPGIKDATLEANYSQGVFSIAGLAHLSVPGIDTINLAGQFDDKGNFAFTADVNLKAMKGIKSGNVKVTITSKEGEEDIKLRVEGKASPDFPSVPNLNTELSVLYDNGIFKVATTVNYQKGRFEGTINVGVTNQAVDDKGNPQGEPNQAGEVVVFGFGELTVDIFKGNKGTIKVRLTPDREVLIAGEIVLHDLSPFGNGVNYNKEILPFPQIEIPLVGIPGLSVSAFISGGMNFSFNWQPLILKQLKVDFKETNINELENVQLDITGSVGSIATAEVYMSINAGLKARALIATLSGSLGGEAGLGVTAEAGGDLQATWNMEKGLQLKEIMAHLDVTPRAIFRLTGDVSIDLDLWVTSVNLYYHKWVLAEKELDMSGLTLKANFPILFNEQGDLIEPTYEKMSLEKPNFTGEQGKDVLDKAINGDAEKELAAKKQEIRATIKNDLRNSHDEDFTPTKYTQQMKKKYSKSPELQEFVVAAIEDESRSIEYEEFEKHKNMIRQSNTALASKLYLVDVFNSFNSYVTSTDVEAFKAELIKIEEDEKFKAEQDKQIAEQAKQEQLAQDNASKPKSKNKKSSTPKTRAKASS